MEGRIESWYLPISRQVAATFVNEGEVPVPTIERAALLAMMTAARSGSGRGDVFRLINEAKVVFDDLSSEDGERDLLAIRQTHALPFEETVGALNRQALTFAPQEVVESGAWRGADGSFSQAFQTVCRQPFTEVAVSLEEDATEGLEEVDEGWDERPARPTLVLRGTTDQVRAVRVMAASSTEHYAVTAFAGTGKTHLMFALTESGRRFMHLAPTAAHRHAFETRIGTRKVPSILMVSLANDMITAFVQAQSIKWVRAPTVRQSTLPVASRIDAAGITAVGSMGPLQVLSTIERSINIWSYLDSPTIEAEHIVDARGMKVDERAALVAMARKTWDAMFAPISAKEERPFTIWAYHAFKWLDIHGASIPPMGTILIDESHELPAPLVSLLRRYADGCIAMGDPYQRFSGSMSKDGSAKAVSMTQSVRAGGPAIDLVRLVLSLHSTPLTFETIRGSREHFTRRHFYKPGDALPVRGFRVYGSVWSLLEDALRLRHAGVPFTFLPASKKALGKAAQDAIDMRAGANYTTYYGNRDYRSWSELAAHLENIGYTRVVHLFERNFSSTDLQKLLDGNVSPDRPGLTLGILEHCKSLEFDVVTMWECCFRELDSAWRKRDNDQLVRAVYLAMTRARNELWLPGPAIDLLAERVRRDLLHEPLRGWDWEE